MSAATVAAVGTVVAAGTAAYQANQNNKAAKKAAKAANQPKTTYSTRTPYMNEYIAQIAPYILSEAQSVYGGRSKGYGRDVGDFSKILANLGNIKPTYTGVGGAYGGQAGGGSFGDNSLEMQLAQHARQQRNAWQRNMPTDLGLGEDQIERPVSNTSFNGLPAMGGGSEMSAFSLRNAAPQGARREDLSNLNEAANEVLHDQAMDRPEGIDINMPDLQNLLPKWLRKRKVKGSSAGFNLGPNPL